MLPRYSLGLMIVLFASALVSVSPLHSQDKKKKVEPVLTKSDVLKADDPRDTQWKSSPARSYTVTLEKGKRYLIELKSASFDAYLRVHDADGKRIAFNDDAGPETLDARIIVPIEKAGDYKIVVTSRDGKAGKFSLSVIEAGKQPTQTGSPYRVKGKPPEIKLEKGKATHSDELNEKDPTHTRRSYKVYAVKLDAGKTYRIDLKAKDASQLDCYLVVETAEGDTLATNDDVATKEKDIQPPDSRIVLTVKDAGTYRIIATSLLPNQAGRFTLEIAPTEPAKKGEESKKNKK